MSISKERGKYRARVSENGERFSLGIFNTRKKAKRAISKFKNDNALHLEAWKPRNALGDFEDIPVRKNRKYVMRKPSLLDKVRTWFNENTNR
jgi:hypothetical protein